MGGGVVQVDYSRRVLEGGDAFGRVLRVLVVKGETVLGVEGLVEGDVVVPGYNDFGFVWGFGDPVYRFSEF